jgi:hypothetical protein
MPLKWPRGKRWIVPFRWGCRPRTQPVLGNNDSEFHRIADGNEDARNGDDDEDEDDEENDD